MPARKKPNRCACQSGLLYRECCRPLHRGEIKATTAEQLMRSRYSAYARKLNTYIHQSWASSTRPDLEDLQSGSGSKIEWLGLEIVTVEAGKPGDKSGIVEFNAKFKENGIKSVLYERSVFVFEHGSWFYLKAS